MNYRDIEFENIRGYKKLSPVAKKHFETIYKMHNSIVGLEYKEDWEPIKIIEHKNWIEVHFKNGKWLHYYYDGTWG